MIWHVEVWERCFGMVDEWRNSVRAWRVIDGRNGLRVSLCD